MGNTNQNQNKGQTILEKYEYLRNLSQDKKIYIHKSNSKQYLGIQRTFATNQMMFEYQSKMKNNLLIKHPYYLNQTQHAIMTVSTICSLQHKVIHFFQYQSHNLQNQLKTRYQHKKYFQQKEIWSILCSCVLTMSYLTKNNIINLCIHPKDMIIDQNGMIKIISPLLSDNNYQILNEQYYYSPQHLKSLKSSIFHTLTNKSSVFTLGITLLQIIFLEPMNYLYEYPNNSINIYSLNEKIQQIQSFLIKQIIKKMLIYQSYDRISFTELEEMLYNILENNKNNSEENSKVKIQNHHQNHINQGIYNQNQKEQSNKLKQSIYQIQKVQKKQNGFEPFQSFRNIQDKYLKNLQKDQEDMPSKLIERSEIDKVKVDEQDIIIKNEYNQKYNMNKFQSTTLNQTGSKITHFQQQSRISNLNLNNSTQRIALHQIIHQNDKFNILTIPNSINSKVSLNQTKKIKPNNQSLKSLKSLNSSKLSKLNNSLQQSTIPYHVREQLNRGVYQGYKLNKMRHGYGVFQYVQGGKYEGQWSMNKMEGRGALYYANGQIAYEGEWKDDKLNGYGILYNQIPNYFYQQYDFKNLHLTDNYWVKYQGNFIDDLKNGQGTLFLANGQYYRGYFQDDLPHGNGIYRCLNGKITKGNWILGIFRDN